MRQDLCFRGALAAAFFGLGTSCGANLLPSPENRAASLPQEADVAVGATHDLLIVACQDRVTLTDFVFPVAATALFVGFGRLDAPFYLPEALVQAAIPECEPIGATVASAAFEGGAFELEATGNPLAFRAHARDAGTATFRGTVEIEGEAIEITSTFNALTADRVVFAPRCDPVFGSLPQAAGLVPANERLDFTHALQAGDTPLSGYGYYGVDHPRLTFTENGRNRLAVTVAGPRGSFTVTSSADPTFALNLRVFDATDFDPLALKRLTDEVVFEGATTTVVPEVSIGGEVPCIWGYQYNPELTLETPTVCGFEGRPGTTSWPNRANAALEIEALAPGTCTLSATVPGTTLTDTVSFEVHRGFESLPIGHDGHPATNFEDLFVSAPGELTGVGWRDDTGGMLQGLTLRMGGGVWGRLEMASRPRVLRAVDGAPDGTVMAVGRNGGGRVWDGGTWTFFDTGQVEDLRDVVVRSASEAYAVGDNGTFLHWDGASWQPIVTGVTARLTSLWDDGTDLYLGGWEGTVKRWDGLALTDALPAGLVDASFSPNFIGGSGPDDVWILSNQKTLHRDAQGWSEVAVGAYAEVYSVGDGTAYFLTRSIGDPSVGRWDGSRLVSIPLPGSGSAIGGVGNDLYVIGDATFLHYLHDPADVFP